MDAPPPLTDDAIVVDPLEAAPAMPAEAAGIAEDPWAELAAELEGDAWSTDWIVRKLTPVAKAPFNLAALRLGPHWRVTDDEVRPILEGIAESVPRSRITDELVRRSPAIAAVTQLADLVSTRIQETRRQLAIATTAAAAAGDQVGATPDDRPRIQIPVPGRNGRSGDAGERPNEPARVDPVDVAGSVGPGQRSDDPPDGTVPRAATLDALLGRRRAPGR